MGFITENRKKSVLDLRGSNGNALYITRFLEQNGAGTRKELLKNSYYYNVALVQAEFGCVVDILHDFSKDEINKIEAIARSILLSKKTLRNKMSLAYKCAKSMS